MVNGDVQVVEAEAVNLRRTCAGGHISAASGKYTLADVARIILHSGVHITTDGGVGERRLQRDYFCFVCANRRGEANRPDCRETQCPFIKLHLFLRCCLLLFSTFYRRTKTVCPSTKKVHLLLKLRKTWTNDNKILR